MPRFAANLTFLFTEVPFLERFSAAKRAGFDAVEVLFPYDDPAETMVDQLLDNDLTLVLINTPPRNWPGGDRGVAAIPGQESRFRHDFDRCLRYAERLKPHHIHVMAGRAHGVAAHETFLSNLAWAASQEPDQSLTIEPINSVDMPGYFLNDFDQTAEIINSVGAKNVGLQFDAYHAQIIAGDAVTVWEKHRDMARHIQVAGVPGRHEPANGEIDYPRFFAQLDSEDYPGFVSGEYHPKARTEGGLGWAGLS